MEWKTIAVMGKEEGESLFTKHLTLRKICVSATFCRKNRHDLSLVPAEGLETLDSHIVF